MEMCLTFFLSNHNFKIPRYGIFKIHHTQAGSLFPSYFAPTSCSLSHPFQPRYGLDFIRDFHTFLSKSWALLDSHVSPEHGYPFLAKPGKTWENLNKSKKVPGPWPGKSKKRRNQKCSCPLVVLLFIVGPMIGFVAIQMITKSFFLCLGILPRLLNPFRVQESKRI